MNTFLAIFNAFPAILQTVQVVEAAIPLPKSGAQKMNLVLAAAGAAWEVGQVGIQINKTNWLAAVQTMANLAVAALNATGIFHGSPSGTVAASPAPVPHPTAAALPVSSN